MELFVGADYKGFEKKKALLKFLAKKDYEVTQMSSKLFRELIGDGVTTFRLHHKIKLYERAITSIPEEQQTQMKFILANGMSKKEKASFKAFLEKAGFKGSVETK